VIQIILVFIGAAVAFGLVHDQITAHICVEYFTIAHERIVASERHARFMADVCAHAASYGIGLLGAVVIAISCVASRRRMAAVSDPAGGRTSGWP